MFVIFACISTFIKVKKKSTGVNMKTSERINDTQVAFLCIWKSSGLIWFLCSYGLASVEVILQVILQGYKHQAYTVLWPKFCPCSHHSIWTSLTLVSLVRGSSGRSGFLKVKWRYWTVFLAVSSSPSEPRPVVLLCSCASVACSDREDG